MDDHRLARFTRANPSIKGLQNLPSGQKPLLYVAGVIWVLDWPSG